VKTKGVNRYFFLGFLNPSLTGVYVLIAAISGIIFATCYFGYGCWFRGVGLVLIASIIFTLLLTVILADRLQTVIWRRLLKQPEINSNQMPLGELFFRACFMTLFIPISCAVIGNKFPEMRAEKI
jgi:hypothetical protein